MNILITGVSGFIGNYFAHKLRNHSYEIIGTARNRSFSETNYKVYYIDIAEGLDIEEPVDLIIHAAAQSPAAGISTSDFIQANVNGTYQVIRYARQCGIRKLIYLSSVSIYGRPVKPVVDEFTSVVDPCPYGISKFLGECLLKDESSWLSASILRLPGVIGKGAMTPWIATLANKMRQDKEVSIYNPDALFNNILCLNDLADFIIRLIHGDWPETTTVTLASKKPLSVFDTVTLLKECLHSESKIHIKKAKKNSFTISYAKAQKMGFAPKAVSEIVTANYRKVTAEVGLIQ